MTTCLSIIKDDNRSAVGLARPFPAMAKMVSQKKETPSKALLTCYIRSGTMDGFED